MRGKPRVSVARWAEPRITPAGAGKTRRCYAIRTKKQDHPRRCGENFVPRPTDAHIRGSPPQVRGKRFSRLRKTSRHGITPAGAGKTSMKPCCIQGSQDHPRRCGENCFRVHPANSCTGSPPQVRGKLRVCRHPTQAEGITPAGAGKTPRRGFRNQPFCSRAVQISFNFSNSLNVSLQSGSAR